MRGTPRQRCVAAVLPPAGTRLADAGRVQCRPLAAGGGPTARASSSAAPRARAAGWMWGWTATRTSRRWARGAGRMCSRSIKSGNGVCSGGAGSSAGGSACAARGVHLPHPAAASCSTGGEGGGAPDAGDGRAAAHRHSPGAAGAAGPAGAAHRCAQAALLPCCSCWRVVLPAGAAALAASLPCSATTVAHPACGPVRIAATLCRPPGAGRPLLGLHHAHRAQHTGHAAGLPIPRRLRPDAWHLGCGPLVWALAGRLWGQGPGCIQLTATCRRCAPCAAQSAASARRHASWTWGASAACWSCLAGPRAWSTHCSRTSWRRGTAAPASCLTGRAGAVAEGSGARSVMPRSRPR